MTARDQQGFTLIELMIVVAIVAILAGIAIYAFGGQVRSSKATEVHGMFAEIRNRQEQYHNEFNAYLSTGTADTDYHPDPPSNVSKTVAPLPTTWQFLRMQPPKTSLYCGYVTIGGAANDATGIGSNATAFGFTAPARNWYYIVAECDFDGNASTNSFYFTHNGINTTQELNPGR
jgi:prepilin-type N-terminal cleavage/methylation domain-containing protein